MSRNFSNYRSVRWLRADDIREKGPMTLTIEEVSEGPAYDTDKQQIVLTFKELWRLGCNDGCQDWLLDTLGEDPDGWVGKRIVVFHDPKAANSGATRMTLPKGAVAQPVPSDPPF